MTVAQDGSGGLEERLVERILADLNNGTVPRAEENTREATALSRELIETLGLVAYENEPIAPSGEVRSRLIAAVRREPSVRQREAKTVVPMPVSGWPSWALPMAAALAIVLFGVVGFQQLRLADQTATIDSLASQINVKNVELASLSDEYRTQLDRMQSQLALVTSEGVEVCPLRPQAAEAAATGARGALFVASDHQHWYLRIDDLEPCPQGRSYQLWFVRADGTAVNGGILEIQHDVELEVTSDTMPEGTVAVHVTLEPAGGSAEPSGPMILYGDQAMRIL